MGRRGISRKGSTKYGQEEQIKMSTPALLCWWERTDNSSSSEKRLKVIFDLTLAKDIRLNSPRPPTTHFPVPASHVNNPFTIVGKLLFSSILLSTTLNGQTYLPFSATLTQWNHPTEEISGHFITSRRRSLNQSYAEHSMPTVCLSVRMSAYAEDERQVAW